MEDNKEHNRSNYPPIESVFFKIDKMAEDNSKSAKLKRIGNTPGKPILQNSNYRMSYGDLNYLGSNKAIFYFDRGIRGKQIFKNSMNPLEQQPKCKDLVVIADIVFTSTCNPYEKKLLFKLLAELLSQLLAKLLAKLLLNHLSSVVVSDTI